MTKTKSGTSKTIPFLDIEEELGAASERFEDGAAHARKTAKKAAGNVRHAVKVGVFNAAFGFSYAVVFSSVFLTELLPEDSTLRRGLEEGADAALDAHAKLKGHSDVEDIEAEEVEELTDEESETEDDKPKAAKKAARVRVRNKATKPVSAE